jgi:hypothetical protein
MGEAKSNPSGGGSTGLPPLKRQEMTLMRIVVLTALLLCPSLAGAAQLFSATEPNARPIRLGSPAIPYRGSLIIKLPVVMKKGEIANFVAEAEGSVYDFNKLPEFVTLEYPMFQTSTVLAFNPGIVPPETVPFKASTVAWVVDVVGASQLCPGFGRDVGRDRDYYYPVVRTGAFEAVADGTYSFAFYMWGGSTNTKPGDAATVYPATAKLTVTVQ